MSPALFIFFTWWFWVTVDFRVTPPGFSWAANLCLIVFVAGLLIIWLGDTRLGFGMCVFSWIVYGVCGAWLWYILKADPRRLYPELFAQYRM